MAPEAAAAGKFPTWVRNQRNSWHGVEYPYHSTLDVAEYYRRYMETLRAVDDSVGRVVEWLRETGQLENTLVIYMGDNGFAFGEHGLIDKRTAFDWSMRVPMLVYAPGLVVAGAADRPRRRQHRHRADDAGPGRGEGARRTCRAMSMLPLLARRERAVA